MCDCACSTVGCQNAGSYACMSPGADKVSLPLWFPSFLH